MLNIYLLVTPGNRLTYTLLELYQLPMTILILIVTSIITLLDHCILY